MTMEDDDIEAVPMSGHSTEARTAAVRAVLKGLADLQAKIFFEKAMTSSDTAGSGRVVIPKAIAEQYFPRLEQQNGLPVTATDTRGRQYSFKYRFWVNNQSRMYLLEGAGELHRAYKMNVGDVMVFAQKPDSTLVVAGRPATRNDTVKKAPVKRPSSKADGEGSGRKREPKPKRPPGEGGARVVAGAALGGREPASEGRARKRAKPSLASTLADAEQAVDGIFRAVPDGLGDAPSGIAAGKNGRWIVSMNLAGELYQAVFDTQEDAQEAYNAAGAGPVGTA